MRFVQSSQRRRCANSCSRITFRSWARSSRNAQAGSTIVRFQKPIAAGTRTYSDVAIVIEFETAFEIDPETTDPDAPIASTVFRTAGSRSAATIGVQLRRSRRRRQSPAAKRIIATHAPRAQAKRTKSAQRPGIVIAGRRLPHEFAAAIPDNIPDEVPEDIPAITARPSPIPPSTGSAATANKARNQTANRVPEFCLRKTRSSTQAKIAIRNPSGSALRIRSTEICDTVWTESQFISRRSDLSSSNRFPSNWCPLNPASAAGGRFPPPQYPDPQEGSRRAARESS